MRCSKPGFTVVEMLVATILLGIGIFATVGAISVAVRATGSAEFYQKAALLAQRKIEELEVQPQTLSQGEQNGDFGAEYPGYRWRQRVASSEYPSLYQVTVTIERGTDESPLRREFSTYLRYDPQQDEANRQNQNGNGTNQNRPNTNANGGRGNVPTNR